MNNIPISLVKEWREHIGATHLIIFAIDENNMQHVATHGQNMKHAREAANMGNELKKILKWPNNLCQDVPLERICKNCRFYKPDYGTWCFNGWSEDGSKGRCQYNSQTISKCKNDTCHNFEPE